MAILQSIMLLPTYQAAREFRKVTEPTLRRLFVAEDVISNCLTAISEVLVNLVEHGTPKATSIAVTLSVHDGRWFLSVGDDGGPFRDLTEAIAAKTNDPEDLLRESGMGLLILGQYFPDWSYAASEGPGEQNILTIEGMLPGFQQQLPLVLLVEDEDIQIDIISSYLDGQFRIISASTIAGALAMVTEENPDLILSDIRLPDGDGLSFRHKIRHDRVHASIPFVFLTGVQNETTATEADALGVDDYLTKPVEKSRLLSVLKRVMTRTRQLKQLYGDRIDHKLSRALVAKIPAQVSDWQCAARTESASAGGGDLLHHRALADRDIYVLADLMGHGEAAKLHATIAAGFLTGLLSGNQATDDSGQILTALSRAFFNEPTLAETIATAIAIIIHKDGVMEIASAGHPPPMLIRGGSLSLVPVSGVLLGLEETPKYVPYSNKFEAGDQLIFLTDGALELGVHTQHDEALSQLKSRLMDCASSVPQTMIDEVFELVFELSPDGLNDDATVLVMSHGGVNG